MKRRARVESPINEVPRKGEKVVAIEFEEYDPYPRVSIYFERGSRLSVAVGYPFGEEGSEEILKNLNTLHNIDIKTYLYNFDEQKEAVLRGEELDYLATNPREKEKLTIKSLIEMGEEVPELQEHIFEILQYLESKY